MCIQLTANRALLLIVKSITPCMIFVAQNLTVKFLTTSTQETLFSIHICSQLKFSDAPVPIPVSVTVLAIILWYTYIAMQFSLNQLLNSDITLKSLKIQDDEQNIKSILSKTLQIFHSLSSVPTTSDVLFQNVKSEELIKNFISTF